MGDDLIPVLAKFHREVVLPDVKRAVGEVVGDLEGRMNAHFDAIYERFDRLESEYHMLVVSLKRVEEGLDSIEKRMALRTELQELRTKVTSLEAKIAELESEL